jgi:peptide methionine sulfoxide reductase MsrA
MKKFLIMPFLIFFSFTGCSKNIPLTCCELTNTYNTFDDCNCSIAKPLDVARGYKRIAKIIFIDKLVNQFNDKAKSYLTHVYYSQEINNPNIHKYCREVKRIIVARENNDTLRDIDLNNLEIEWVKSYKAKLNNDLKGKIRFNELDGCEVEATKFQKVLFDRKGKKETSNEHYLDIKRIYDDCIFIAKKKQEQAKTNKMKKELLGETK